jgi:ferredoxin-type protein NapG
MEGEDNSAARPSPLTLRVTRRSFLELAGKSTFLLGLGGLVAFWRRGDGFLRPPGALAGVRFSSLCIKCQRCQEVCPTRAITPVLVTEDLASAGTPRLNFRFGYCSLCRKCMEVCPTGALASIPDEQVRLGVARVDKDKCIAWDWVACTKCQKECPAEAIYLDEGNRPVVDADRCNGCGQCEYVCIAPMARTYHGGGGKGIVVTPIEIG